MRRNRAFMNERECMNGVDGLSHSAPIFVVCFMCCASQLGGKGYILNSHTPSFPLISLEN